MVWCGCDSEEVWISGGFGEGFGGLGNAEERVWGVGCWGVCEWEGSSNQTRVWVASPLGLVAARGFVHLDCGNPVSNAREEYSGGSTIGDFQSYGVNWWQVGAGI